MPSAHCACATPRRSPYRLVLRQRLGRRGFGSLVVAERARHVALYGQRDGDALAVADRPGHRQRRCDHAGRLRVVRFHPQHHGEVPQRVAEPPAVARSSWMRRASSYMVRAMAKSPPALATSAKPWRAAATPARSSDGPAQGEALSAQVAARRSGPGSGQGRPRRSAPSRTRDGPTTAHRARAVLQQRLLQPATAFGQVATRVPEVPDRRAEPQRGQRLVLHGPAERRAQVVVLGLQALQPRTAHRRWRTRPPRRGPRSTPRDGVGARRARPPRSPARPRTPERFPAAANSRITAPGGRETLLEQRLDAVENREPELGVAADGFGRVEGEAADEHRHAAEQPLLRRVEEVVAPGDRGRERPLPGRHVPRSADEQRQARLQAFQEQPGREHCRRAAASSIASGSPSSRLQISATAAAFLGEAKSGAACARVRRTGARPRSWRAARAAAGAGRPGSASGGTGNSRSPARRSGARLVTSRCSRGSPPAARHRGAAAGTRARSCRAAAACALSGALIATRSVEGRLPISGRRGPRRPRRRPGRDRELASATNKTPSAKSSTSPAATSIAKRVLPMPPGPSKVTRRSDGQHLPHAPRPAVRDRRSC